MKNESSIPALETNIEANGMNINHENSTSDTRLPRTTYLRPLSLPVYENVMAKEGSTKLETPPPEYNVLIFPS